MTASVPSGFAKKGAFRTQEGSASIPAGTTLNVRMIDELGQAGKTQKGDSFRASLDRAVVVDGRTVASKDALVRGTVTDVVSSGRLKRPASLTLKLTQVTLSNGPTASSGDFSIHVGWQVSQCTQCRIDWWRRRCRCGPGVESPRARGALVSVALSGLVPASRLLILRESRKLLFLRTRISVCHGWQRDGWHLYGVKWVNGDTRPFRATARIAMAVGCLATVTGASSAITFTTDTQFAPGARKAGRKSAAWVGEAHSAQRPVASWTAEARGAFPQDLVSQLPRIADRIRRVILGRRALMLDDHNTILDEFLLD